jgi:hypothetical protein
MPRRAAQFRVCLVFLACLALASAARAQEGGMSGNACGEDPQGTVGRIFTRITTAAGVSSASGSYFDPASHKPVQFIYSGRRMAKYDCASHSDIKGTSIGSTTECDDTWGIVFGLGLCEAARSEDEIASVIAHEVSHLSMRHGRNRLAYMESLYVPWLDSDGRPDFEEINGAINADLQARIQAEHPELSTIHDPAQINQITAPYYSWAADQLSEALWQRLQIRKKDLIDQFAQRQESEADANGINLMGQAGFDRDAAADMMEHGAQLRTALDFARDNRHPPPAARAAVLRQIAARMRSGQP